jgi:protein tyrosine/serine phosphatase
MERRVAFEGCCNFRDLGGYATVDGSRVRWRRLYRSDSLHRMTASDAARLVDDLGARTAIDLRMTSERARAATTLVETDARLRVVHLPVIDEAVNTPDDGGAAPVIECLADMYAVTLRAGSAGFARALRLLTRPDTYPAVFYCASGKDRTGLLAALVLSLVGVPDDDIVADYTLTAPALDTIRARLREEDPDFDTMARELPPDLLDAPAAAIATALGQLRDEHGSIDGYAEHAAVTAAEIGALRALLLEPDG